jgi:Ca-activated chloride channel family protein
MEPDAILRAAKERNVAGARVFTFGVGGDVQTRLLDRLAEENGGLADVVQPGEKIDERTAKLLDRVGAPVLSGLRVEFDGVRVGDLQPQALPDLFKGGEVVVAGRYSGPGRCAVVLRGRAADGERAFRYDVNFPERDARDFEVARLWARRKVAWLLDQARLHGNPSKEVIDEIVSLSKTYRVATPFTSFLITEEGDAAAQRERVKEELLGLMRRATKVDADGLRALRESRLIMDAKR